jgi:hypothetical protein
MTSIGVRRVCDFLEHLEANSHNKLVHLAVLRWIPSRYPSLRNLRPVLWLRQFQMQAKKSG